MASVSIQSKLGQRPMTIFTQMSQLAIQHQAVNLGQGFPDYPMDSHLMELVIKAMQDGHNQYAHTFGYQGLREILAAKVELLYGLKINSQDEITITPGGTYAISNALTAMLRPSDEVILFEPSFDSYIPNIEVMGAKAVCIPLQFPSYAIPWDLVQKKVTEKTRLIILNTPHNPTATVLQQTDIEELRKLVEGTNILILSDEVYEHLIYDGGQHESILRYPDLLERSFVAFSLGKVFHCTGWKIGYTIAPAYLTKEFRNHHQFNVFSVNSVFQVAMAKYLENPKVYTSLPSFFEKKRDLFLELMNDVPLKPLPSKGSYFQNFTFDHLTNESDADFSLRLVEEAKVATIPISAFYRDGTDNKVLRFCFAKKEETLEEAAGLLKKFAW